MDPYSSHRLMQQFAYERDRLARQLGTTSHPDLATATAPGGPEAFRRAGAALLGWLRAHASRPAVSAPWPRGRAIVLGRGGTSGHGE